MRYWWVNQKQTHRHEVGGGYLWSPKRRSDDTRNQFYENMRIVAPGDVVFGYWETAVRARGTILSYGYDAPKPEEFGQAGPNWSRIGYRVDVSYRMLRAPVQPRDEWLRIQPLLPDKYSPLHKDKGIGLQSVYLAALPDELGSLLEQLIREHGDMSVAEPVPFKSLERVERDRWEHHELDEIAAADISETERVALTRARLGQGKFRDNVRLVEPVCRLTGVSNPAYLIASHIKPWRYAENDERLSGNNGLMLAPQADFLFDRGFISFGEGRVLVSDVADPQALLKLGVDPERPPEVGAFNRQQETFLEFHRRGVFRKAM